MLTDLGFLASAAVLVVGVTTAVILSDDLRAAAVPLLALWGASMAVFAVFGVRLVNRIVMVPLERLAAEADALAKGELSPAREPYTSSELERLAERYRAMATELLDVQSHAIRIEKLAGLGQLAAGVAHEIRNPLGALGTYVEVLRRRGSAPEITPEMQRAIERIDRTVQGLLDYARPDAPVDTLDLNAAVRAALDFLGTQGMLSEQTMTINLAPDLPPVRGDRHAIEQVVINLLVNACQASPRGRIAVGTAARTFGQQRDGAARGGGSVAAAATRGSQWSRRPRPRDLSPETPGALLYVADDGPGIPEADRERVFDPFFTTKAPGEGTGLGLALVARAVHEAGGVVWVGPAREGGAVFKVFLPDAVCDC